MVDGAVRREGTSLPPPPVPRHDPVHATRARAALLRLRGVAARPDAWLALTDAGLPPRGELRGLADEIGVTPEALYRELARRRVDAPST